MRENGSRKDTLVLGTRGSPLALWQSHHVRKAMTERHPGLSVELKVIKTSGDQVQHVPLPKIGDKGLFTRELEQELIAGSIHLAVHSLKDLPTSLPEGLIYAGSPTREDVRDAFVSVKWKALREVPDRGQIATGSVRRKALLQGLKPGLRFTDLRGNIDTRIRKLREHGYDGILMAAAALKRLDRQAMITEALDPADFIPAVGQGAIGIEIRQDHGELRALVDAIVDPLTTACCRAERAFMQALEGGCSVALGAWARTTETGRLRLTGFVSSQDGRHVLRESAEGHPTEPEALGDGLAQELIGRGARQVLGR